MVFDPSAFEEMSKWKNADSTDRRRSYQTSFVRRESRNGQTAELYNKSGVKPNTARNPVR